MKFSREALQDAIDHKESTVEDVIVGHGRWSVTHRRVFRHEGRFFETHYSVGSTENQDESPYEYSDPEIECAEVWPCVATAYTKDMPGTGAGMTRPASKPVTHVCPKRGPRRGWYCRQCAFMVDIARNHRVWHSEERSPCDLRPLYEGPKEVKR